MSVRFLTIATQCQEWHASDFACIILRFVQRLTRWVLWGQSNTSVHRWNVCMRGHVHRHASLQLKVSRRLSDMQNIRTPPWRREVKKRVQKTRVPGSPPGGLDLAGRNGVSLSLAPLCDCASLPGEGRRERLVGGEVTSSMKVPCALTCMHARACALGARLLLLQQPAEKPVLCQRA